MWFDTIKMLNELGEDIRNPKNICPKDLRQVHDDLTQRINKKRHREWEEAERRRANQKIMGKAEQLNAAYTERCSKFFDLDITNGVIHIRPLRSVEDFMEEGLNMHHCVFSGAYYEEEDSLILSARIGDKRIETVEVNLQDYDIPQCYGAHNSFTPYHETILQLVEANMEEIKKLNQAVYRAAV